MFKEGFKYFEHTLSQYDELLLYKQMYRAIKERKACVLYDFQKISRDRAYEIYKYVYEDNPSFYYVNPSIYYSRKNDESYFGFCYLYDEKTTKQYENHIKKLLMEFFDKYRILELPKYNRILLFHNFIASLCHYDTESYNKKIIKEENFNIIGVFQGKVGVCYGFSQVFKLLCDYAHINCLIVCGGIEGVGDHAWNMVEYKGKYYHIDTTWDLDEERIRGLMGNYQYFMVDDHWIEKTRTIFRKHHYPISQGLQASYFYYHHYVVRTHHELTDYFFERLQEYPKEIIVYVENQTVDTSLVYLAYEEADKRFQQLHHHSYGWPYFYFYNRYGLVHIILKR